MKINLQITFDSGESKEITCNAADMVAFEDKFNLSISNMVKDSRMSYMLYLAWHSEKRTKGTTLDFDKWLESVDQVGAGASDPK